MRRHVAPARAAALGLALVLVVVCGACGRRSAESKAAERAQDACIGALAPVAKGQVPSADVLDVALADARAAADVDDRWGPLVVRVQAAERAQGTPDLGPAVDALAAECAQVNEVIKRGGREPSNA